ncbi:S1 family peptidase [Streptoalloteichus hindustanus]|uniref:Trypsin n=1 Tax=Streptoalloteichus hindustanus TaxID=2017 RepID=A0A1M5IVI7_STRHI|nr:serine protease [Streptoalloteichus hindustanus]SHG32281.1 Trypsin [Streptoalloteichus hindustanus]
MRTRFLFVSLLSAVLGLTVTAGATAATPPDQVRALHTHDDSRTTSSFTASLQHRANNEHHCGASLIKPDWLVTAAHCVVGRRAEDLQARVGSGDRTRGGTLTHVTRVVVDPRYQDARPNGDIALVQVSPRVEHTPVRVARTGAPAGARTREVGWEAACPDPACGITVLREVDTAVTTPNRCDDSLDASTEICALNPTGVPTACRGDTGGPQVRPIGARWELVGTTSRRGARDPACATGTSIHTNVTAYRAWIEQYAGPL